MASMMPALLVTCHSASASAGTSGASRSRAVSISDKPDESEPDTELVSTTGIRIWKMEKSSHQPLAERAADLVRPLERRDMAAVLNNVQLGIWYQRGHFLGEGQWCQ